MKVALFCHVEGNPSERKIHKELCRQYALLENYAHQHGLSIEYIAFHTNSFCLDSPDKVFLALLQHTQAREFDTILVESKTCFPLSQPKRLPPIKLYFLQEAQRLEVGTSTAPIFQSLRSPLGSTTVYWRQDPVPTFDFFLQ